MSQAPTIDVGARMAAARAASLSGAPTWTSITGKPATFPPSAHTHDIADVTGLQGELDAKQPLAAVLTATTASFTTTYETKLNGIAAGATVNSSDATLLARANHTGTQAATTISDFNSASRAQTEAELVAGTNVTITPSGSGSTRQLTIAASGGGGGGSASFTTIEVDFGTKAVDGGVFTIAGAGLTVGKPVLLRQAMGPYTGKGTYGDDATMDRVDAVGIVTSTTLITCHWVALTGPVLGNFKFDYLVGA